MDIEGVELIRVNYNNGDPYVVPEKDLQDKSDRYYFHEAIVLDKGDIYTSPLDLNIEKGEIEIPYKPMLRIGTPYFDNDGKKRGVVFLN